MQTSRSSRTLLTLPLELQREIISHALVPNRKDYQDPPVSLDIYRVRDDRDVASLLNWSSTCKWFRTLLAPRCFETISLWNSAQSALSVHAIAQGEWAGSVKTLRYVAQLKEGQECLSIAELHPPEVEAILNRISQFPNLEQLTVSFLIHYQEIWSALRREQTTNFINVNPAFTTVEEKRHPWRALLSAGVNSIIQNPSYGRLETFEIQNLGVFPASAYGLQKFRKLFSKLKTFRLSFSELGQTGSLDPNFQFFEQLGPWFFNNLRLVENLSVDAGRRHLLSEQVSYGFNNTGLREARMPKLRNVKFQNLFLCKEVVAFLTKHLGTLESITLENCYGNHSLKPQHVRYPFSYHWWQLFDALKTESPTRLVAFELNFTRNEKGLIQWGKKPPPYENEWYSQLKKSEVQPGKIFLYGVAFPGDGLTYPYPEAIQESLREGLDERGYLSLMAMVECNVKKRK
ncbi:hypothetical protein I7I51_09085 [Histoplasma capsulatum]|uniref:F-box domain-containing protein n=1 Tax=Ajellomyces capsulatus TaxID=5037 RepID=A0A8A1M0S1_AJECA|nr:predicted protein [Histoplasma mississippiense (nom. inval.)]EDN06698.1 predicted protein [Histoplasma mississippiense (nom. inval.)]QSS59649.1 hypothetical protein I7I51_09085 [Histoplasma capsulatum]